MLALQQDGRFPVKNFAGQKPIHSKRTAENLESAASYRCALPHRHAEEIRDLWAAVSQPADAGLRVSLNPELCDMCGLNQTVRLRLLEDGILAASVPAFDTTYEAQESYLSYSPSNAFYSAFSARNDSPSYLCKFDGGGGTLRSGKEFSQLYVQQEENRCQHDSLLQVQKNMKALRQGKEIKTVNLDWESGSVDFPAVLEAAIIRFMKRHRRLKHGDLWDLVEAHVQQTDARQSAPAPTCNYEISEQAAANVGTKDSSSVREQKKAQLQSYIKAPSSDTVEVTRMPFQQPKNCTEPFEVEYNRKSKNCAVQRSIPVPLFKKRLESLLEREFIARDKQDPSTYIYVP